MAFEGEDARRWSMVDAPTLQPAVDFVTKSPNGPFLDTGINVIPEMRGRVYLSVDTIKEMAEIAGLFETKDAQGKTLYDLEVYNRGYRNGLKEGEELLGKLTSTISHLTADDYAAVLHDVETVDSLEAVAADESGEPVGDSGDVQKPAARKRK
jgi:hypothetical protein